jgi:hypothetical protein
VHHLIGWSLLAQDITDQWWFYAIGVLILAGLVVVFFMVRNKREED